MVRQRGHAEVPGCSSRELDFDTLTDDVTRVMPGFDFVGEGDKIYKTSPSKIIRLPGGVTRKASGA